MSQARMITAFGKTLTAAEWVKESGVNISPSSLIRRLNAGLSPEKALTSGKFQVDLKRKPQPMVRKAKKEMKTMWIFVRTSSNSGYYAEREVYVVKEEENAG